jgi:hypothetical protein
MDERSERILREARETIERVDELNWQWAQERRDPYVPLERERPRAAQPQRKTPMTTQPDWSDWNTWARTIAKQEILAYESGALGPTLGDIGKITGALRREVDELRAELGQLKAEREVELAAKIIDLPNPLRRRSSAA